VCVCVRVCVRAEQGSTKITIYYYYYYTRLTASFPGQPVWN